MSVRADNLNACSWVRAVTWSPDGKCLPSELPTSHSLGHKKRGTYLLVSGRDGTTRLWDVQRGEAKTSEEVARVQVGR